MEKQPGVKQGYNQWAQQYDTDNNPLLALEEQVIPQLWGDVKNKVIADLGCGTGRNTVKLLTAGATVEAVDFSEKMLDKARRKTDGNNVTFHCMDLTEQLHFRKGQFDGLLINLVLEHIEKLEPIFSECKRITRNGGFILVSEMHPMMRLKDAQASYRNFDNKKKIRLPSVPHKTGDYIRAARKNQLKIEHIGEHKPDAELLNNYQRAKKYKNWPMLFTLKLTV